MSPHGCDREGIVTISTKIDESERDRLDSERKRKHLKSRSDLLRSIISKYLREIEQKGRKKQKGGKKSND